ncbi:hypothetical protein BDD12DRAFT_753299 [Trichophaea hybrida]|nr:hypothetical protein BDD12DRAFT_753299 [Trichophaea hybrida]
MTQKERDEFSSLHSIDEVYAETHKIQTEQGQKGLLRNTNKIQPYLLWLQQFSGVIEVFVQVKPDILGLIWGPIKLLLQITSKYIEIYDQMLDVFSKIGHCLPQFQRIQQIFNQNIYVNNFLALLYQEIIEFHVEALRFFRAKGFRAFFKLLWPGFQERFSVILGNIENHKLLIDREMTLTYIKDAYESRNRALSDFEQIREVREKQDRESLERYLDAPLFDEELEKINNERKERGQNTGQWLFQNQKYQRWVDINQVDVASRILWISGIPGAGKTYQCAALIEHIKDVAVDATPPVVFAFLRHDTAFKRTRTAILHSFIFQLFHENQALLPVVLAAHKSEPRKLRTSTDYLRGLLKDMIQNVDTGLTYIFIDGLDECEESERQLILKTALELTNDCPILRLAIGSREEKDISRVLKNVAQSILVNTENNADISWYISAQLQELSREISPSTPIPGIDKSVSALRDPILQKADAYLYPLGSDAKIEMNANFISSYGRILSRIREKLQPNEQHQVRNIVAWLVSAKRPMKTLELLNALMIREGDRNLEQKRRLYKDMVHLCGPFIEEQAGAIVFVHFSAKE